MAEVGVKIYCANSVGSCTTHLIFSNGPRSTLSEGSVQVAEVTLLKPKPQSGDHTAKLC
jgi:hypothetical protein